MVFDPLDALKRDLDRVGKVLGIDRLVLDIGAGPDVDSRATHAVDLQAPMWLSKDPHLSEGVVYHSDPINLGPLRYFLFGREIKPYNKLPYESDTFDLVVSYSSLGVEDELTGDHGYQEAYRVLKGGGSVEIAVPYEFRKKEHPVVNSLLQTGFIDVKVQPTRKYLIVTGRCV